MPEKKLSCIESFCGAGGMGLGLQSAGFDVKLAFDLNEDAIETYKHGVDQRCMVADASKVSAEELLERADLRPGEVDVFTGGPPCQGFSKQRRGAHIFDDPRNLLIKNYIQFVKASKAKAFVLENVAIFGQKRGKVYLEELARELCEYRLFPHFYKCSEYGLAQSRERFIMVGIHKDFSRPFIIPKPSPKRKTVGETIGDLPEPPLDYSEHPDFANHQRARVTSINIERFSHVPQGGGWQDIPYDLRLDCHKKANTKSGGWPDVYGRLEWDGLCPTITGGFDSFTRGRYGHPIYDRPLTPREAARLQGFPDAVRFFGTRQEVRYQIGNAVPPPLAEVIGKEIANVLLKKKIENESSNFNYYQEALAL